jgi:hypothetical protein
MTYQRYRGQDQKSSFLRMHGRHIRQKVSCFWQTKTNVRFRSPRCRGGKISPQINPDKNKSSLVGPHSATTWEAHHVWSVAKQRESRLSAVRKRRDRALSTLLACRQSSTALRGLLVNDVEYEEEELRKLLTRRSRLMMRSTFRSDLRTGACAKFQASLPRYIPNNEASDVAGVRVPTYTCNDTCIALSGRVQRHL